MKHPITQGRYVAILNTHTQAQADARKHTGSNGRYAITGSVIGAYTRPCRTSARTTSAR